MRASAVLVSLALATSAYAQAPSGTLERNPRPDPKAFGRRLTEHARDIPAGPGIDVRVSLCVDETGKVSDVRLVESGGIPELDEVTLSVLPETPFAPALDAKGRPVAMCAPPYMLTVTWRAPD